MMIKGQKYKIDHCFRGQFEGVCLDKYFGRSCKIEITKGIAEFNSTSIKKGGIIYLLEKNMTYEKIEKKD